MGGPEWRYLVTGVGMAAGTGVTVPSIPPLTAAVNINSSAQTWNVTGASGDLYTQFGVVIVPTDSGGVPPYFDSISITNDGTVGGSGSSMIVAASDGVHNTIGWSGVTVGAYVTAHIVYSVTDSNTPPGSAGDVFPHPAGSSFILHRVS